MKNPPLRLDPALRLSLYLTLGTAALAIGWAEQVFVPGVGWLMAGYTVCAIWGLTLFYLDYGGRSAGPAVGAGRSLFAHFLAAGRWAGVTAGVAVLLFLLLPRSSQQLNLFLYFSANA